MSNRMTTATRPRLVSKNVALNPIARSLSRKLLSDRLLFLRIRLYQADPHETEQHLIQEVSRYLCVGVLSAKNHGGDVYQRAAAILDLALVELIAWSNNKFKVKTSEVPYIDASIELAKAITDTVTPIAIQLAEKEIHDFEQANP